MATFSVSDVTGTHQDGELSFTVSLDAPATSTVTVDYTTANNTAAANIDYKPKSGRLVFYPGQSSKTVSVEVYPENTHTADAYGTFEVNLYNPMRTALAVQQAIGMIGNVTYPASFNVLLSNPVGDTILDGTGVVTITNV